MGNSTGGGATPYGGSAPYGAAAPPEDATQKTGKGGFRKGANADERGTLAEVAATPPSYNYDPDRRGSFSGGGYRQTAPIAPEDPAASTPEWKPWMAYNADNSLYTGIEDPTEKWNARQNDMNAYYRDQWSSAYGDDSGFQEFEKSPEWWAMDPNVRRGQRDEWYRKQYNKNAPEGAGEGFFSRYNSNQFAGGEYATPDDEYKAKINSMRDFYMNQYKEKYGNTDDFQVFNRGAAGFYDMPMGARKDLLAQFYQRQFSGNMGQYGQYGMGYQPHDVSPLNTGAGGAPPTGLGNPMFDQQV